MAGPAFRQARKIATAALNGTVFAPVGNATHYHADWVVPYWASSLTRATQIGAHIFYRWKGFWGGPRGFKQSYAGLEPILPTRAPKQGLAKIDRFDLVDDRKTVGDTTDLLIDSHVERLADGRRGGSRLVLKADELAGSLLPTLQRRPTIVADIGKRLSVTPKTQTTLNVSSIQN
jgi:hypothetical protein